MASCSFLQPCQGSQSERRKLAWMENKERILEASEHLAVVIPKTTILMLCLCEPMSECKLCFCYLQRKNLLKQCWLLSSCLFLQLLTQGLAFKRGSINLAIDTVFVVRWNQGLRQERTHAILWQVCEGLALELYGDDSLYILSICLGLSLFCWYLINCPEEMLTTYLLIV